MSARKAKGGMRSWVVTAIPSSKTPGATTLAACIMVRRELSAQGSRAQRERSGRLLGAKMWAWARMYCSACGVNRRVRTGVATSSVPWKACGTSISAICRPSGEPVRM